MAAPTFVSAYSVASYMVSTTPKTVSVTSQAGDLLVVYGGSEDVSCTLGTPSGNGVAFNLQQSVLVSQFGATYIWTGADNTGGTGWTLTETAAGGGLWGFTCCVFRNASGFGNSAVNHAASAAPSASITTAQDNSAIVVFNTDWQAMDGSSRVWLTVNGITPTAGNGLELNYETLTNSYSAYGAYYNDAGTAGGKTVGLSAPTGQNFAIVAQEVKGSTAPPPVIASAWLSA